MNKANEMMKKEIYTHSCDITSVYDDSLITDTFNYIEQFQLLSPALWERFVNQFRCAADSDMGWRGEYWGKMMRGACMVYSYTENPQLYDTLCKTVRDMIDSAEETGRISTYPLSVEFGGWDLWCRKYVLLGMEYFLEICKDSELNERIITSMRSQVDYIMAHIGATGDKKPINKATRNWRGLNSSSILEPIVRLYNITADNRYLEFAEYIVESGCTDIVDIFELAYDNGLKPYQYPVTKAYEMISCFEGLIEYYKITKINKYRTAIVNFANSILESDFTVIGCCGCTHELFDHSTVRQANTTNDPIMQETCVTVTLMKFLYRVYLLTGDTKYVDAFEISFYNAYLGSINTEKIIEGSINEYSGLVADPLPFDSYSPLTSGMRGKKIGGFQIMNDMHYYGCCACIGSAGIGLVPKMQFCTSDDGFAMNMFINGSVKAKTPSGSYVEFVTDTTYPKNGRVTVTLKTETSDSFLFNIRIPSWSRDAVISVNDEICHVRKNGYAVIDRLWKDGDMVNIDLDMSIRAIHPTSYGSQVVMNKIIWSEDYTIPVFDNEDPMARKHIAFRRGPIMLAQENRLGYSVDDPAEFLINDDGSINAVETENELPYPCILSFDLPTSSGSMTVTDYSSAGKLWNKESKMAVWMLIK